MINLSRKVKYKIIISLILILSTIGIILLFSIHRAEITKSLTQIEGMWDITIFILIRISITIAMAYFSFLRWFKQEKLKFININFLFGLFFLGLAFGKSLDLLYKLIYFTSNEQNKLIVLKIRYILIILTSAPLILIGIDLILNSISNRYDKLTNDIYRTKFSLIVIIILIIIQVAFVIVAFDIFNLQIILICCHLPSLAWIIYTFFYAYRKKTIFEINTLIIAIVFLLDLVLYIISVFLTPIRQKTVGFSPIYTIFAELIDLIIIIIIFLGYIKKPNYISEN